MIQHNLDEFKRELRAAAEAVPRDWVDRAVRVGSAAYAALTEVTESTGSVDTGAYRAEHVIEQGGAFLFEHPGRVGPDTPLPSQKALGQGPLIDAVDPGTIEAALEVGLRPDSFNFANRRFYGLELEFGSARIEPRQIYSTARDVAEKFAERIVTEPSRQAALRE